MPWPGTCTRGLPRRHARQARAAVQVSVQQPERAAAARLLALRRRDFDRFHHGNAAVKCLRVVPRMELAKGIGPACHLRLHAGVECCKGFRRFATFIGHSYLRAKRYDHLVGRSYAATVGRLRRRESCLCHRGMTLPASRESRLPGQTSGEVSCASESPWKREVGNDGATAAEEAPGPQPSLEAHAVPGRGPVVVLASNLPVNSFPFVVSAGWRDCGRRALCHSLSPSCAALRRGISSPGCGEHPAAGALAPCTFACICRRPDQQPRYRTHR